LVQTVLGTSSLILRRNLKGEPWPTSTPRKPCHSFAQPAHIRRSIVRRDTETVTVTAKPQTYDFTWYIIDI
jgi:hypothetical protein